MRGLVNINLCFLFLFPSLSFSQSIVNTVHNLSTSGPGTIKAINESEICFFCHTPHNTSPKGPLWNRRDPGSSYKLYGSSTTQATIGQPDGSSILCLSCHDGTIALGNVLSRAASIDFTGGISSMPKINTNLTTDLADDHPISFLYNSSLAVADGELIDPVTLMGNVQLENNRMQCTSCHDPHKNIYTDFLVASTQNSNLCINCHQNNYWITSSHRNSTKTWNGTGNNPWFHTPYTTVNTNACENCHNPHNAGLNARLLNYQAEENNCFICHNSNVAEKSILQQFNKTYRHNVTGYNMVHDANENALVLSSHVECEDCHNPHASNNLTASAPDVKGYNAGTKGINSNGSVVNPVQFAYEICYRCHADSPDKSPSPTTRKIEQNNVRLEFDLSNPSYHPIEGVGKNSTIPSLISPWTTTSIMYCTDCHASDGVSSPAGPHGSIYPSILKFNYSKIDNTMESANSYSLCYSCHSRSSILADVSFTEHQKHIVGEKTPCNVCHDPHGISSTQGNSTNNSNLINFQLGIVTQSSNGILRFEDQGNLKGRCYLTCHGKNHNPLSY